MPANLNVQDNHPHHNIWQRNNLRPSIRFQSPLYMTLHLNNDNQKENNPSNLKPNPVVFHHDFHSFDSSCSIFQNYQQNKTNEDEDARKKSNSYIQEQLTVTILQRLETVNSLWDASTVMCGYLVDHLESLLLNITLQKSAYSSINTSDVHSNHSKNLNAHDGQSDKKNIKIRILELGSGCGTTSIVAYHLSQLIIHKPTSKIENHLTKHKFNLELEFIVTELDEEIDILEKNIDANKFQLSSITIYPKVLYWGSKTHHESILKDGPIDLILATDIIYEIQHFDLLLNTLKHLIHSSNRPETLDACYIPNDHVNVISSQTNQYHKPFLLMAMEHRWADIENEWWRSLSQLGFRHEEIEKDEGVWYNVPKIDLYQIY